MSIAIATTILNPGPSFVAWLDYHLRRVKVIVIYMDNPLERPRFERLVGGRPVVLFDGNQDSPEMTPSSRLIIRQGANMRHAIAYLLEQKIDWLLHIDIDEILYENGDTSWETLPNVGHVSFTNHEAMPVKHNTENPFVDCTLFKVNGRQPFMAYGNGKSAVRLTPGVEPNGPHMFAKYQGEHRHLDGNGPVILHYPNPSFESWVAKFKLYGKFSNFWFDNPNSPNGLEFMLKSRDHLQEALATGDWKRARKFYNSMILDLQGVRRALASGDLRHYAPFAKKKRAA